MTSRHLHWRLATAFLALLTLAQAGFGVFDLDGPRISVRVIRAGKELPVSEVPNLLAGDRLWLHPEFTNQSARYLLVVAFLRGATNPPPESWFTKVETWNNRVKQEGTFVTVPQGAEQALFFLAPEMGGDFSTLRSAVRGKPGAFVRASQDLEEASVDRLRVDKYLSALKQTHNPQPLQDRSAALARTLSLKLNKECFEKPTEDEQARCLTQDKDHLVLDDEHGASMVAALTSGASADLLNAVSVTPMAGGGAYSPYLGVFMDLAKIMDSLHTAVYQYIPALALPSKDQVDLKLNSPPSFRKPKSVLVAALPAVEKTDEPVLHQADPKETLCLDKPPLVLAVEGPPTVYATDWAHNFSLHLPEKSGQGIDLAAEPDAARGGFVVDTHGLQASKLDAEVKGTLRGRWGFESFTGPTFHLRVAQTAKWTVPSEDQKGLIVGREDVVHLESEQACCVNEVSLRDRRGKHFKASWKLVKPDELEARFPLEGAVAGPATIWVTQAEVAKPDQVAVQAYGEAAKVDSFSIHAGDHEGVLKGARLEGVESLELNGIHFAPAGLTHADQEDDLRLACPESAARALQPDEKFVAHVSLKDGRVIDSSVTVQPPRPKVTLISKNIETDPGAPSAIRLGNRDELPQDAKLTFVLKSHVPATFPRTENIEVATVDGSYAATLTVDDGNLTLQDSSTVLAVITPQKDLGSSAFGPLRFRPVDASGAAGDWQPLAKLVRLPVLKEIRCPDTPEQKCTLNGTNLFLIESVAAGPQFLHNVSVPIGFVDSSLSVPRPNGTLLYLKLRDDPSVVNTAALPVLPEQQSSGDPRGKP